MKTYDERTQEVMEQVARKKKARRTAVALSSTLSVCVVAAVICLVLFLPYAAPEVPAGSPYQSVINVLQPRAMAYRNNYEKWSDSISFEWGISKGAVMDEAAMSNGAPSYDSVGSAAPNAGNPTQESESYQENTNLQVEGVREGDLLKQSTNYFYYLYLVSRYDEEKVAEGYIGRYYYERYSYTYELCLDVFRKQGLDTALVTTFKFAPSKGGLSGYATKEMYLNDACDTLTVVAQGYNTEDGKNYTVAMTVDVSNLENIAVKSEQYVTGSYVSSRMVDGRLLVITDYYLGWYGHDFTDPTTFIPYVSDADGDIVLTAPANVVCSEDVKSAEYAVVTLFDESLGLLGQEALMGYACDIYANQNHVYVTCYHDRWSDDKYLNEDVTDVVCLSYGEEGVKLCKTFMVKGSIANQYSMDEYEGVFRVATSLRTYRSVKEYDYEYWTTDKMNSGLYCFDVNTWELVGKAEYFAPADETVRSARFMGKTAYICTAVQSRDPVFCFDLSDYANITYTQTPEITGFSMSLTPFVDDTMVGIGVNENWNLKVELYRATQEEVVSVAKFEDDHTSMVDEYKSYLFDKEDAILGMPGYYYNYHYYDGVIDPNYAGPESGSFYFLFAYRDGNLKMIEYIDLHDCYLYDTRCAVSGEGEERYVYVFSVGQVKVVRVADILAK